MLENDGIEEEDGREEADGLAGDRFADDGLEDGGLDQNREEE